MDQRRIKCGSTWINVDQAPSACRLQPVAAVLIRGSCVVRPRFRLMAHASGVRLMAHASGVRLMAHASCVRRHGSCVMRQTHGSCVRRPRFRLMAHASCVRRQTHGSCVRRPTSLIQLIQLPPVAGHDDNRNGGIFPICYPIRFAPIELNGTGNRGVLPHAIQLNGRDCTNKNSGRRSFERRPLLLLIRKRPA